VQKPPATTPGLGADAAAWANIAGTAASATSMMTITRKRFIYFLSL
jgi:hypothetical protein